MFSSKNEINILINTVNFMNDTKIIDSETCEYKITFFCEKTIRFFKTK